MYYFHATSDATIFVSCERLYTQRPLISY